MRKRLKAIIQDYEAGEIPEARAARKIERLLDRELDRLEDQGRLWGAAADAAPADGSTIVIAEFETARWTHPLGYLNRGLEFHAAVLDLAAPRKSLVARAERAVEAGRLTREEAEARLERALERRIDKRFDGRQEKTLLEAAERLDTAADALLDFRGFKQAAMQGERFRPDDLDDAFELLRPRASDIQSTPLEPGEGVLIEWSPEPVIPLPAIEEGPDDDAPADPSDGFLF